MRAAALFAVLISAAALLAVPSAVSDADAPQLSVSQDGWTFAFAADAAAAWNFGDGSTAEGSSVTHTYTRSGLWKVSAAAGGETAYAYALCADPAPIAETSAYSVYRYCPGMVRSVSTDCPGLTWQSESRVLTGTPTVPGDYDVAVTAADGSSSSFTLRVGPSAVSADPDFAVSADGLQISARAASAGTAGLRYMWTLADAGGSAVGVAGNTSSPTWTVSAPGEYTVSCVLSDSSGHSVTVSRSIAVEDPQQDPDGTGSDNGWMTAAAIIAAAVLVLIIIARFV
ncbi:PKD domain-containing protein [Candidatus Methanomethylophilus sp. 1R26]|uniref:PKD domain-containing protein n=1 Tax=Candidatus Methanomethylophilus sp. 1R26 TaxID=1769296 RepID=UPI0012FEC3C2|nr:PKD domain-containing protein [Candidatus Methanomethylophilus sp. 1R26]